MNDFTKEELQKLFDWSVSRAKVINTVDFEREGSGRLFDKIKSMIDNYCEHELDNSCCGCSMRSIYCTQCDCRNDNTSK